MPITQGHKDLIKQIIACYFTLPSETNELIIEVAKIKESIVSLVNEHHNYHHFSLFFHQPSHFRRLEQVQGAITKGEIRTYMIEYVNTLIHTQSQSTQTLNDLKWNKDQLIEQISLLDDHNVLLNTEVSSSNSLALTRNDLRMVILFLNSISRRSLRVGSSIFFSAPRERLVIARVAQHTARAISQISQQQPDTNIADLHNRLRGLNESQTQGIVLGLSRTQVLHPNFDQRTLTLINHLRENNSALSSHAAYTIILALNSSQIEGMILGLSLEQVQHTCFNRSLLRSIQALRSSHSVNDAFNISINAQVSNKRALEPDESNTNTNKRARHQ